MKQEALDDFDTGSGLTACEITDDPEPFTATPTFEAVRRIVELDKTKKALEDKLKAVAVERAVVEPAVLEYFQTTGTERTRVDGRTVYVRRQLWAGVGEGHTRNELCDALIAAGMSEFVAPNFNTNSLSSWARELEANGQDIPPELIGLIKLTENFNIGTRA